MRTTQDTAGNLIALTLGIRSIIFLDIFDSALIAESGMKHQVKTEASKIRELVKQKNDAYFGVPISKFEEYKTLIDNLYFVFHKGVGQRLAGNTPESFSDIRDLRTALDHDVDHGKSGKVKKKKVELGTVFKKYGGETSPGAMDPEKSEIVQANLLARVRIELGQIAAETV